MSRKPTERIVKLSDATMDLLEQVKRRLVENGVGALPPAVRERFRQSDGSSSRPALVDLAVYNLAANMGLHSTLLPVPAPSPENPLLDDSGSGAGGEGDRG